MHLILMKNASLCKILDSHGSNPRRILFTVIRNILYPNMSNLNGKEYRVWILNENSLRIE
jgi:hypothetical protein